MNRPSSLHASLLALTIAAACSGEGDIEDVQPDANPNVDEDGYQPLIAMDWSLEPYDGTAVLPDVYRCKTTTLTEDILVSGFRAIAPLGTHHTAVTVGDGNRPDGEFNCYFTDGNMAGLVGSGVGTDDFNFPEGVGFRLRAGQQLMLNAHLFNATDGTIAGNSGMAYKAATTVEIEAENTLANDYILQIPPNSIGHKETGTCMIKKPGTIFYFWPHMHRHGRRMTIAINDEVVLDEPFSFTEQIYYPVNVAVKAGDVMSLTCTYDNDTELVVGLGGSTNDEMCLLGFWRYPSTGEDLCDPPF